MFLEGAENGMLSRKRRALAIDVNGSEVLRVATICPDIAEQTPQ